MDDNITGLVHGNENFKKQQIFQWGIKKYFRFVPFWFYSFKYTENIVHNNRF